MDTQKAREVFMQCGAASALVQHLADHDAETAATIDAKDSRTVNRRVNAVEERLAGMSARMMTVESRAANALTNAANANLGVSQLAQRMADAETRIRSIKGCVEILERRADAQDEANPAAPDFADARARIAKVVEIIDAPERKEPEDMICPGSGQCSNDRHCGENHPHSRESWCVQTCGKYGPCITVSEHAKRKAAAEQAAKEAEAEAKKWVKGARVEVSCHRHTHNIEELKGQQFILTGEHHRSLDPLAGLGVRNEVWQTDSWFKVCDACARVVAPPKPELTPECGDEVVICESTYHIVGVAQGKALLDDGTWEKLQPLHVISRPALVAGEQVKRRSDGRAGFTYAGGHGLCVCMSDGGKSFTAVPATNADFERVSWNPELHKEAT